MAHLTDQDNTLQHLLAVFSEDLLQRLSSGPARRINNIPVPLLAAVLVHYGKKVMIVEDTAEHAEMLVNDMRFFSGACGHKPAAVECFRPPASPELVGERARIIQALQEGVITRIVTSADAIRTGFAGSGPATLSLSVTKGMNIERAGLETSLVALGYRKVNIVMEKGEYAERGWLFDVYPSTEELPVRIEFYGDEVDLVRTFDIETQRSVRNMKELLLYPAEEIIPEVLPDDAEINNILQIWDADIFINLSSDIEARVLEGLDTKPAFFSHFAFSGDGADTGAQAMSGLGILPGERTSDEGLAEGIRRLNKKTFIVLPVTAQIERTKEILSAGNLVAPVIPFAEACKYEGAFCFTQGRLSAGLHLPGLLLLTGRELYGEQPAYRPIKKARVSKLLLTIDDLKPGDFVVHKDHGIGRFIDLHKETIEGFEADIITIEYARGDRLHIPVQSIEKLSKYSGGEGNVPALDRLGSSRWQNTRKKVKKSVMDMAEKLLALYAERRVSRGFVFSDDTPMHAEFDDFFPYEETEDQIKAVQAIKKHMQSDQPMDMLICGDVGYGKTEVAIKAAFRAVYDSKQVAVLVPTTLLAEQHYRTFKTRFAAFPVRIDYLSRFKNSRDSKKTIEALAKGETDIIVGTHMLLNKSVRFQDLGLLIVDEEHKFGVAQKERMKELRKGVDVITLTATPIPRTLHMSLSGIREMETIETPPEERLAVRSTVAKHSDRTIKEAIDRELKREGQVFFVHNRIFDMEKVVAYLKKLAPQARIAYAHGQMAEREIERIMLAFLNRELDVLLSTAIISSGLDIPTANTIIIDRADSFGLSDLYQLRGRVGRGNIQAYAYFLIPGENLVTDDAKKRLQAIQEMSYLGAGFRLALKDLEIRGAGNLLGGEQSGHIYKVGFEMYMEMLEKAVAELRGGEVREEIEPEIRLHLPAFIPEEYVSDITLRLGLYKRLAAMKSVEALEDFISEMEDRFGKMPDEALNLVHVMRLKVYARQLFISRVSDADGWYRFIIGSPEAGYQLPGDFAAGLPAALFDIKKRSGKEEGLRLLQNGFEIRCEASAPSDRTKKAEVILKELADSLPCKA